MSLTSFGFLYRSALAAGTSGPNISGSRHPGRDRRGLWARHSLAGAAGLRGPLQGHLAPALQEDGYRKT